MNTRQSVCQSPADPVLPQQQDRISDLTGEQRAFAKVIGQALAQMWLKESRQKELRPNVPDPTPPQ